MQWSSSRQRSGSARPMQGDLAEFFAASPLRLGPRDQALQRCTVLRNKDCFGGFQLGSACYPDVGLVEIVALEQRRPAEVFGCGVRKAISEVELGRMTGSFSVESDTARRGADGGFHHLIFERVRTPRGGLRVKSIVQRFFELSSGFELRGSIRGELNGLPGFRVASSACGTHRYRKGTEARDNHSLAPLQRTDDAIEQDVDGLFGFNPFHRKLAGKTFD